MIGWCLAAWFYLAGTCMAFMIASENSGRFVFWRIALWPVWAIVATVVGFAT